MEGCFFLTITGPAGIIKLSHLISVEVPNMNFERISRCGLPFFLLACGGLRIFLKLFCIDPSTGFYEGGGISRVAFTLLVGVGLLFFLILGLLQRPHLSLDTIPRGKPLRLLSVLTGLSAFPLAWDGIQNFTGFSFLSLLSFLVLVVGPIAGGCVFLLIGLKPDQSTPLHGLLLLLPLFWQGGYLLKLFMRYTASRSVSDQLLEVLMLILLAFSLLANGRLLGSVDPSAGLKQLRAFGRGFVLLAVSLGISNLIAAILNRSMGCAMSPMYSLFYLLLGLYILVLDYQTWNQA